MCIRDRFYGSAVRFCRAVSSSNGRKSTKMEVEVPNNLVIINDQSDSPCMEVHCPGVRILDPLRTPLAYARTTLTLSIMCLNVVKLVMNTLNH